MGGRRKKGLKEKVKEKLTSGKNKEEDQSQTKTSAVKTTASTTTTGQHHEKKSVIEKIKEKLPGHHAH